MAEPVARKIYAQHNPPKKKQPELQILNEEQLQQFMSAIEQDGIWRDFFYTEIKTGLRRGEICGLKWTDFNEDEGSLRIDRSVSDGKKGGIAIGETKTGKKSGCAVHKNCGITTIEYSYNKYNVIS